MDDLLKEFIQEATEHIDATSAELLRFEKDQGDPALIASLFRHIHTIKGSSGFLSLPRIARLTHATETLIGRLRDGATASPAHVSLIFAAVDRLSALLADIACAEAEPEGDDSVLLRELELGADSLRPGEAPAPPAGPAPAAITPHLPAMPEHVHAPGGRIGETVRVSVGVLDRLMGIVSELVLTRNQLLELAGAAGDETVKASVQNLSSVTSDLQDAVMRVRLQPVERLFATLPRLVRDLSIDLGKKIELVTIGAETELDRQVIELIRAPLTHIIRNAADHGIESAAARLAAGKPEAGVIRISAACDAGQITLEVKDDGRGLDLDKIRARAIAQGLATQESLARMSDQDIFQFVMLPGFSTASSVTTVSGRGVGMDVVRENIHSIGGTVSLNSKAGKGTTVALRIPLTLAIAPALILTCGGSRFAIPQIGVIEVVGVGEGFDHRIELIQGAPVLRLRGETLPLVDLAEALGLEQSGKGRRDGYAIVLRIGGVRFGLLVETIADVQEVVIEPMAGPLTRIGAFSGQTILGDGAVVLILDPADIVERMGVRNICEPQRAAPAETPAPKREKTRLVLMRAGAGALKALPLSLVMRIEEVALDRLTPCDGDGFLLSQEGRLLPILPAARDMRLEKPSYPILILAGAGNAVALLVEEVVDVVEEPLVFQKKGGGPGVIGAVCIGERIVEILDTAHFIEAVDPAIVSRGVNRRPRILLVDDKPFFRDMLGPVLLAAGYEVTTAGSGSEALSLIERGLRIHLVVTDIDMPEMDGYALARALLQTPGRETLPIVALASQPTATVVDVAARCGLRAAVGKFDRRTLIETVGRLLDGAPSSDEKIERRFMAGIAA